MRRIQASAFWFITATLLGVGCAERVNPTAEKGVDSETKLSAALQQLSPEDRKLAEEQKYCAVMTDHRLGSMGKPVKVFINQRPVFLCCESCEKRAVREADKTLATVEKLKAANAPEPTKSPPATK